MVRFLSLLSPDTHTSPSARFIDIVKVKYWHTSGHFSAVQRTWNANLVTPTVGCAPICFVFSPFMNTICASLIPFQGESLSPHPIRPRPFPLDFLWSHFLKILKKFNPMSTEFSLHFKSLKMPRKEERVNKLGDKIFFLRLYFILYWQYSCLYWFSCCHTKKGFSS